MSCGAGECAPEPFRCSCQRGCLLDAADYAACVADCDPECTFPGPLKQPSKGFRCDSPDHDACILPCTEARAAALDACSDTLSACNDACSDDVCFDLCSSQECRCTLDALQAESDCRFDCDVTVGLPVWLGCADDDINDDQDCCNTLLGDCYAVCEHTFSSAISASEAAFFACEKSVYSNFFEHSGLDGDTGACITAPDLAWLMAGCESARLFSQGPAVKARRICRATCERDEINADRPEDRKRPHCGGRNHLERERCLATFDGDNAACGAVWLTAVRACYVDNPSDAFAIRFCMVAAASDYYSCATPILFDSLDCLLASCKQEHPFVRHQHAYADCEVAQFKPAYLQMVECQRTRDSCVADCSESDLLCTSDCADVLDACWETVKGIYGAGLGLNCTQIPDCPDCGGKIELTSLFEPEVPYPRPGGISVNSLLLPILPPLNLLG